MKNRIKKLLTIAAACGLTVAMMGCGDTSTDSNADQKTSQAESQATDDNSNADNSSDADITGKVTMAGSTSMEKLC